MTTSQLLFANPLTTADQALLNDPYPLLAQLRNDKPVYYSPKDKYWLVSRYDDVAMVLRDARFGKQIQTWKHAPNPFFADFIPSLKALKKTASTWLLNLNPPDHTRVRSLINQAFSGAAIQKLTPRLEELCGQVMDDLALRAKGGEPVDFIEHFAMPFPLAVIALILGIPVEDRAALRVWANQVTGLVGGSRDGKTLLAGGSAALNFGQYLKPHIEARRAGGYTASSDYDLLGHLVQVQQNQDKLSIDELVSNSILLLVAGFETTTHLLGNAAYVIDKYPQARSFLLANPDNVDQFVQELLRFESPAQVAPRLALEDVNLHGETIRQGDMVWTLLGSANRDENHFERPEHFDATRDGAKNLAFGEGAHRCVGASLAQLEAKIAVSQLISRYPRFELTGPHNFKKPFGLRGLKAIVMKNFN